MAKDIDVGAYLYSQMGWVDSWRLQKLTYYSQAWGLAWSGRPLFEDRIQAWDDGPVAPELFRVNKYARSGTSMAGADVSRLRPDELRVVDAVIAFYGAIGKQEIINLTHAEQPWKAAYDSGRNTEISQRAMAAYYCKVAAQGVVGPVRPDLPEPEISDALYMQHLTYQRKRWAGTLELLAR